MSTLVTQFFPNLYRDSVALMQLSSKLAKMPGVSEAAAQMATKANLELMKGAGLLQDLPSPRPNDILLVVRGQEDAAQAALQAAEKMLNEKAVAQQGQAQAEPLRSIQMALQASKDAGTDQPNLVLISTPGDYAGAEAMKALRMGLNVMLFSDNVSVQTEVELKRYASERNLLVMGPDCGTAIIDGVPLAFANVTRQGDIGVVGASGTGTQQVTCVIDQLGAGITHAIGTGGHDLSEAVGGLTMLTALSQLAQDPATRVIALVSKPPAASVADKVLAAARTCGKPVVVCFLGADPAKVRAAGVHAAATLEEAAHMAVALSRGTSTDNTQAARAGAPALVQRARQLAQTLKPTQNQLRGLYTGGTFCYEALLLLQDVLPQLQSNTPTGKVTRVADLWKSSGNTILDLGDDDFTRGRPHPMIDPSLRNERLVAEAADAQVGVVLLDFVLGYGANSDPAGEIIPAIVAAREKAAQQGRKVLFIGHICGTDSDPQGLTGQRQQLEAAGVELASSNAEAVFLCRAVFEALAQQPQA